MYKQSQLKKCLSVLLSIVVGVSSFGLTGFAQSPERPDTVYHGKLICDLDEHSHSKKCCREASTSDAKKEETFCGLKEHVHSADCYEAGEPVTEDPKAEESKKEDSKTETPEINPSEPEAEQPESAEETLEVESARIASYDYGQVGFWTPGRYPDAEFHVTTFEELMAAVNDANEKDKYYWITLENDIEWNDVVTISNSAILFNINGHTVDITTKSAMLVKQKMDVCIKGPGTINVKAKALETSSRLIKLERRQSVSSLPYDSAEFTIDGTPEGLKITAEGEYRHPGLIANAGRCYLSNIQVEDYLVHGSLIQLDYHSAYNGPVYFTENACSFNGVDSDGDGAILQVGTEGKFSGESYVIELNSSTFTGNHAVNGGVACIKADDAYLTIYDGWFQNNSAEKNGGALFAKRSSNVIKLDGTNNLFEGNTAGENGGAICANNVGGKTGRFIKNTAQNGGGIYADNYCVAGEAEFTENHAVKAEDDTDGSTGNGGAVYSGNKVIVSGRKFSGNTADGNGGAVYAKGKLTINDGEFSGNKADGNGGAVYTETMEMNEGNFSGNTAAGSGGALYAKTMEIDNGSLSRNFCHKNGGAVYAEESLTINNGTFESNTASGTNDGQDGNGGGVYTGNSLTVLGGIFAKNKGNSIIHARYSIFKPEKQITVCENSAKNTVISSGIAENTFYDAAITENTWRSACVSAGLIRMENGRSPAVFDNIEANPDAPNRNPMWNNVLTSDGFIFVYGTMLGEGSANWHGIHFDENDRDKMVELGPVNKESGLVEIVGRPSGWYADPSEQDKTNALAVSPSLLITKNEGNYIFSMAEMTFYTNERIPEKDPEKPTESESPSESESSPESERPSESESSSEVPEESSPIQSTPEESLPAESTPEETLPAESTPEETKPAENTPEETLPTESTPEETKPAENTPEETLPTESTPEETKPAENTPEETLPTESTPEETKPTESIPGETLPAETVPLHTGGGRRNADSELPATLAGTASGQEIRITSPSYIGTGSWQANAAGTSWKLQKPDGSYAASEWGYVDGAWYLFGSDGYTCTGWQKVNSEWYYFQPNAVMKTDWIYLDDKWYYLDEGGAMKKGWVLLNGKWYFLGEDGVMFANTRTPDGYIVDENGEWKPENP